MRKITCFFACLWGVSFGLHSCSDSDRGIDEAAMLQMYGAQYAVKNVVLWKYNPNVIVPSVPYVYEDTYVNEEEEEVTDRVEGFTAGIEKKEYGNFTLSLYEEGLTYNPELQAVYGKAACICFHLSSPETGRLLPGKYVYSNSRDAFTFYAYASSDYDTENSVVPAEITEGEITVGNEGNRYEIRFTAKTSFGGEIRGTYEGPVQQCEVEQDRLAAYENIHLAGLLDVVEVKYEDFGEEWTEEGIDKSNGAAFLATSTGICTYAKDKGKESVEIALVWDKEQQAFQFESPIRMRSYLGHSDDFNFPCHTIYMKAPSTFTDTDFDRLGETGFDFEVEEETVVLPVENWEPCYVFFLTGQGNKGVLKIKDYTPLGEREEEFWGTLMTYPVNPAIVMDLKVPATYNNLRIR